MSGLKFISLRSLRTSIWSFDFLLTFSKVCMILSHTFFSICITLRQWRKQLSFQYKRSNNMLFFSIVEIPLLHIVHQFFFSLTHFSFFFFIPNVTLIFWNCSRISTPDNLLRGLRISYSSLKRIQFNLKLCLQWRKHQKPIKQYLWLCGRWRRMKSKLQDGQGSLV